MKTKEISKMELIGIPVRVVAASNLNLVGIAGTVTDETRNTLELDNRKKILKQNVTLSIQLGHETFHLPGKQLLGKPEDRLKKVKHIDH